MGFFKKIFKGVKKVFKKIGKGIKKTVGKVGKFMGKLGIVGQIGLGLLLPGVGSLFGQLASTMMGSTVGLVQGAGQFLNAAVNVGTRVGNVFSTITEGVGKVLGEVAGATLNKLGVKQFGSVSLQDKGFASIWETTQKAFSDAATAGKDLFSMDTLTAENVFMKKAQDAVVEPSLETSVEDPFGYGEQPVAAQPSAPKPSLLSQTTEKVKETVTQAPGRLGQALIQNVAAIPRDVVKSAMTPAPEVTYDVRQAAIPDIGFAGIGQESAQPAFDPISYFDQNQATFNQSPFGFGAAMYGEASYARNMKGFGFEVPVYGMS